MQADENKKERRRIILRRHYLKKQAEGLRGEAIGTAKICKNCGLPFNKIHKRQFYCEPCMALAKAEKMPSYAEWNRNYMREYSRKLRENSPKANLNWRMAAGIKNSLKGNGAKAGRSWESLLGFTVHDLMQHLERQFLPGMSWDNRGEWHIDHIRPLNGFNFSAPADPEFREAWALTNLRPLWAKDNISKSARRTHLI